MKTLMKVAQVEISPDRAVQELDYRHRKPEWRDPEYFTDDRRRGETIRGGLGSGLFGALTGGALGAVSGDPDNAGRNALIGAGIGGLGMGTIGALGTRSAFNDAKQTAQMHPHEELREYGDQDLADRTGQYKDYLAMAYPNAFKEDVRAVHG